jgi:hypothetical protein
MDGDLTSRNTNNGEESNKDNLRVSSQNNSLRRKFSGNRDNLRVNSQDNNPRRELSHSRDKSKDLRFSKGRENRRFSSRNTLSLKENLKEGRQSIGSRLTRSLETLRSLISVG